MKDILERLLNLGYTEEKAYTLIRFYKRKDNIKNLIKFIEFKEETQDNLINSKVEFGKF